MPAGGLAARIEQSGPWNARQCSSIVIDELVELVRAASTDYTMQSNPAMDDRREFIRSARVRINDLIAALPRTAEFAWQTSYGGRLVEPVLFRGFASLMRNSLGEQPMDFTFVCSFQALAMLST